MWDFFFLTLTAVDWVCLSIFICWNPNPSVMVLVLGGGAFRRSLSHEEELSWVGSCPGKRPPEGTMVPDCNRKRALTRAQPRPAPWSRVFRLLTDKRPSSIVYKPPSLWSFVTSAQTKTLTNSLTPTRCPAIQFNPDTVYLELASDPTSWRAQAQKTAPLQLPTANEVSMLPILLPDEWQIQGFSGTTLLFSNLLQWLKKLRKMLNYVPPLLERIQFMNNQREGFIG